MAHKTAEFDQMVERLMEEFHVPGVSIAIVQGDEIDAKVVVTYPNPRQDH